MVHIETTNKFVISQDLVLIIMAAVIILGIYFFGTNIQLFIGGLLKKLSKSVGIYSVSKDYQLQKYIYQHNNGLIAWVYRWVNTQIIALGLKRQGVSVFGYLLFWAFVSAITGVLLGLVLRLGVFFTVVFWGILFVCYLILTRVSVAERMERCEADVMNAVDLIIPEAKNGIKNAIVSYKDNFALSIRDDFNAFITNIQDRGYSFEDAMMILADNLGNVFLEFAQKAIQYERNGDKEMLDVFTEITETNRFRRTLRDENAGKFAELKMSFIISAGLVVAYFCFLMFTDEFSRVFFLQTTGGKVLLIIMVLIVFLVLAYISTIKSREL